MIAMNTKIRLVLVAVGLVLSGLLSSCDLSGGLVGPMDERRASEVSKTTCKLQNPTTYHEVCK
jgi:hypothetical protein